MRRIHHHPLTRACLALPLLALAAAPAARPTSRPATRPTTGPAPAVDPTQKMVYVCILGKDAPAGKVKLLQGELRKAIAGLKPYLRFNLVFPGDKQAQALSPDGSLITGTLENKKKAYAFVERVKFPERPDPLPAITAAFAGEPDVVFLLAGGDFPDNDAVVKKVAELNPRKAVQVYTIQFAPQKFSMTLEATLQRIAKDSGGVYRYVSEEDLKQPPE